MHNTSVCAFMNLLTALSAVEPSFSIVPTRRQNHQESIRSWCQTMITRKKCLPIYLRKKPYKPTLTASNATVGWNLICVAIFFVVSAANRRRAGGQGINGFSYTDNKIAFLSICVCVDILAISHVRLRRRKKRSITLSWWQQTCGGMI